MLPIACLVLAAAILCPNAQAADANGTYSIVLPKYVRPGVPTKFVAEILKSENPINVQVTLESSDWKGTASDVISEGESRALEIDMIPYDYEGATDFKATAVGTDTKTGAIFFNATTKAGDIQFQNKFLSIFIQTDKAIYQPSQMIKFRAVVTTSDILPYVGNATYKLIDPNGNVILMERDANLVNGVVGSEFQLGRYATLGDWQIVYQVFGYEERLPLTVQEYKLPKFKVEINPTQSFLHPGSVELSGEITGKFTFGQPVKGKARIEFTIDRWRSRNQIPEKIVQKYPKFDGKAKFTVDAQDVENILMWNPKWHSSPLKITAFVTDKNTGDEFNATTNIDLHSKRMKVETIYNPSNVKPGLPYTAYVKVSEQDGTLLSGNELKTLNMVVETTYNYPYDYFNWRQSKPPKTFSQPIKVGDDGMAAVKIVAKADDFENININIKILSYPQINEYWTSWIAKRFESPSDTYLQVSSKDSSLTVGDKAKIIIQTTESPKTSAMTQVYWIMILARGKLIKKELYTPSNVIKQETSYKFIYEFDVTGEMSPSVYVVVSYIRPDSEIVGDSMKITVQATLANQVVMTTNTSKTDAGMPVTITVNAAPGSFVGLRAIDQSVLLLKKGNDITQDKIFQDLDKYGPSSSVGGGWDIGFRGWWWPWPVGGADVSEVFDNSGVIVLTDALLYKKTPDWRFRYHRRRMKPSSARSVGGPVNMPARRRGGIKFKESSPSKSEPAKTRNFFPESWIWSNSYSGPDGSTTFSYTTPDTITTWELSSFAVSNTKGLGVTKKNSEITVFRNFFISLNLPPTMVRGEILLMKTTLFNYFDSALTVAVLLKESEWYDLVITGTDPVAAGPSRLVTVPPQDSITIVYPIKLMKAGTAKISVMATSAVAGDAVERTLVVKPEGIPKIVSHSTLLDRPSKDDIPTIFTFNVDIPKDAVEGSSFVKFSVSGNILGKSLSNLGNLLQMPSGCGEQTMISFAPDVFISLYLQGVGELTGEIKQKSETHIRGGYQNELRYQREDGSFSAFGKNDRSGSTWLTAFVVKSFIAAKDLNPDLIEDRVLSRAVNFLLQQQNKDGTFNEPGRVIHTDMQGGVESEETLAAYLLIAKAEGKYFRNKNEEVEAAMKKTQKMLEARVPAIRDIYTLSIVAYALSLVESEKLGSVMAVVDAQATVSANLKYWAKDEAGVSKCEVKGEYCPYEDESSSSSIEITSYILMTYVKMGRNSEVIPIVRWLVEQRSAFGGYRSTQDTVVGIQALATVASLFADRPTDVSLEVTHDGFSEDFTINKDNVIVLQTAELPNTSGTVTIKAVGVGVVDVQVSVHYNLPSGPRVDEPFDVDVEVTNKNRGKIVLLKVCSTINEDRKEVINGTGMFVITAILPSGYTVDDKEETRRNKQLKLVELVGQEVSGYFDEMPRGTTNCMTLQLIRIAEVSDVKPQILKVMDYYKPERSSVRQYKPETTKVCDLCGDACVGCPPLHIVVPPPPCGAAPPRYCDMMKQVPCPDLTDGLYYDSKSHIKYMMKKKEYATDCACRAPLGGGNSQSIPGLPATLLNGENQYILCSQPTIKKALTSRDGFTLSMLIQPREETQMNRYNILSFGAAGVKKPYFYMEKRPKLDQYWVKARLNGYEMTVRSVKLTDIRLNVWTLVTVTYDGSAKLRFYVNGVSKGIPKTTKMTTDPIKDETTLKIGRSHLGNAKSRGDFKGSVSSLDLWLDFLSADQVMQHYRSYQSVMLESNPLLQVGWVHHVVPFTMRGCFGKSYTAADLKEREGQLRTSCSDVDVPPPPPFGFLDIPE